MHVAVSAVGVDRPGIVAAISRVLFEHGGNIEDSRMAILGGHFAMMLIVALPDDADAAALEGAVAEQARSLDLVSSVRPVSETGRQSSGGAPYVLTVYGADHPGIVWHVSQALADRGVNITDLATHVVEGEPAVYVMILEVIVPDGSAATALEAALKEIARDVGVDVSMRPADADTL